MNAYVSLQTERNWLMEGMRIFLTLGRIIKGSCFGTPNLGKKKEVLKSIPDMLGLFPITQTKIYWHPEHMIISLFYGIREQDNRLKNSLVILVFIIIMKLSRSNFPKLEKH